MMNTLMKEAPEPKMVLTKAVVNAARSMGLTQSELGHIIGKDRTSIARGLDPTSKSGELALMLVRCYRALSVLVGGDPSEIKHWFTTPNSHIGGVPKDVAARVDGLVTVTRYLDAIRGKV
jgi:hypothetical protein